MPRGSAAHLEACVRPIVGNSDGAWYARRIGYAVLRLFAGVLHERLRSADLVARYGGEEFIVILEDCAFPEVVRVADEVRRGLEARTMPGAAGQPLRATVSAGCAVLYAADPTREALLGRADAGLYMAKEAGRNRVVTA